MRCFSCRISFLGLLLFVAVIEPAAAQDQEQINSSRPWALGFTMQTDEHDSQSFFTTFNWGVAENTWLYFSAGRSTSPAERADITTDDLLVGVDHSFGLIGASLELENWGESGAVESRDVRGSLYLHGDRFSVSLEREARDIDLTFTVPGMRDRVLTRTNSLTSDGTGVFFHADLTDWWRVYGSAREYEYSRPLAVLPRLDVFNLLSSSTLTLANSFLEDEQYFGFEWRIGNKFVNLWSGSNTSAVDGAQLDYLSASFLFPVSYRVDLEFNLGRSETDYAEPSLHGGIMVLIYGGS